MNDPDQHGGSGGPEFTFRMNASNETGQHQEGLGRLYTDPAQAE
jgi:hypothetical protein